MYGIEIIGYGKNRRFCLKKLVRNGTWPVDGKSYRTEESAREAAQRLNLQIVGVGDLWELASIREERETKD